jgi:hypothetical protein
MNTSIKILLLEPFNPIDNPHRGSGDLLENMGAESLSERFRARSLPPCFLTRALQRSYEETLDFRGDCEFVDDYYTGEKDQ